MSETTISDQYAVLEKYRVLCETALDAKLAGMNGIDLFVLSGAILADPVYSARYVALATALPEERGDTEADLPMQVVRAMTRDERLALRARLQEAKKLPRG